MLLFFLLLFFLFLFVRLLFFPVSFFPIFCYFFSCFFFSVSFFLLLSFLQSVMACQLFGAQSIPKPMMVHFHFGPFGKKFHWGLEQKYMRFLWWKCLFITETVVFYSDFKFKQFDRVVCKMTAIMFMFQCVYERKGAVPWEGPDFVVQGARR